jgi:hypothetical protein
VAFTEDLTAFFDTDDFATSATYTSYGGSPATVKVIKDEAFLARLDVYATNPVAFGKASDFSAVAANGQDTLLIGSTTYRIKSIEPQDDGSTVLLQLEKQ